jgi:molecular chaperone DnaK (HSP70)
MGAKSFDASVLEIDEGVFEVLATTRDDNLSGDAFNDRVVEYLRLLYPDYHGLSNLNLGPLAQDILLETAEEAKLELSNRSEITLHIDPLRNDQPLEVNFTRSKFEALNADLFSKAFELADQVFLEANVSKTAVSKVVHSSISFFVSHIENY